MDCYCISGLGADQRIFNRLRMPGVSLQHLPWLLPLPDEPIAAYAYRMCAGINAANPILLGVSFGGMMAIEIAKYYPAATVILMSSIRNRAQGPGWMKFGALLHLDRWMSGRNERRSNPLRGLFGRVEDYYLGVETKEDAAICRTYREEVDRGYVRWAVGQILHWENQWSPGKLYQVHGGRDRIFRLSREAVTHYVPDGGHFMIHNRPEIIGDILAGILENPA